MVSSIINSKKSYYILGIFFIFIVWIILNASFNNSYIVPSVSETITALVDLFKRINTYKVLGLTVLRLLFVISICLLLGVLLSLISCFSIRFKSFLKPVMALLKTLPIAVVIILLLVMFTREYAPVIIVGVVVLPLIYTITLAGFEGIDSYIKDEVKMLSNNSFAVVKEIYLPLNYLHILTALIQSFGLGLKVLVMAEYLSQPKYSIGNEIVFYKDIAVSMEYVYAWSIILVAIVLVVELLISYMRKKLVHI